MSEEKRKADSKRPPPAKSVANEDELTLAATTLAIALTRGKTVRQLETLVNLLSITLRLVQGILTQRSINTRRDPEPDLNILI